MQALLRKKDDEWSAEKIVNVDASFYFWELTTLQFIFRACFTQKNDNIYFFKQKQFLIKGCWNSDD